MGEGVDQCYQCANGQSVSICPSPCRPSIERGDFSPWLDRKSETKYWPVQTIRLPREIASIYYKGHQGGYCERLNLTGKQTPSPTPPEGSPRTNGTLDTMPELNCSKTNIYTTEPRRCKQKASGFALDERPVFLAIIRRQMFSKLHQTTYLGTIKTAELPMSRYRS